jgi:hypothetical protein
VFWPIVIGIGTLLAAQEYERRANSVREDGYKLREAEAVKAAKKEWKKSVKAAPAQISTEPKPDDSTEGDE